MFNLNRCAKVNVKLLAILILVTVAIASSLFAAREVRRSLLSKMDLEAGQAAFEKEDWATASKHFQRYLGRNPDDVEVLKKYAKARLSVRPLDTAAVGGTIAAYRRVVQLDPLDKLAYGKLAELYAGIGNFDELAYIARKRVDLDPNDLRAPLWLADALVRLHKTDEAKQTLTEFIKALDALAEKPAEYVRACMGMSQIVIAGNSSEARTKALEWLNTAVDQAPESVNAEALARRAKFYRETSDIPNMSQDDKLAAARKDLDTADASGTQDPRVRLLLGAEWMAHGQLDRAAAELKAAQSIPQKTLEEYFFDINDWTVVKFRFASELAIRNKTATEGASLADQTLATLKEARHRIPALPSAITLYIAANKVSDARRCLDEYLSAMHTQQEPAESRLQLAYLQALVAKAEQRPYVVIDVLQPVAVTDASRPELWQLLAEAFSQTDQTRRAVSARVKYLRIRPRDPEMTLQLAREYLKLQDYDRAFETARLAEPLDPTDIIIRLLRIEASMYRIAERSYSPAPSNLEALSAELAQLRKDHPDRVDIRVLQAVIAGYLQKPDEAERELKDAIEQCPEPLRAEMQLVRHYYMARRVDEALSTCRTACERHPELAEPWLSLAGLYVAKADYASARSALTQGRQSVVGQWEKRSLSIQLAMLELLYADRAAGIRLLSEIASQDKQEIYARSLLLGIREVREDQARAETLIGELRTAEGESGLFWRLYQASLLLSSDDWRSKQPQIADALQYCLNSDPEWSVPALLLAEMYEKLDDLKRAEDTCRQALTRNPAATDVADRLLLLLEKQGRFSETQQVLQQIQADARLSSAWRVRAALSAGDLSRAIDELKLRVSNNERDANSRIQLARLIYRQDVANADEAFKYLKEAEAIAPKSLTLTAVRASILRAQGQTQEARRILDDYVADSNDFNAYWMRAVYLAEEGDFERAEKDYKKLTTFEKGAAGYSLLASFYLNHKKLAEAAATLQEGSKAYPADMKLKRELMRVLFLGTTPEDRARAQEILASLEDRSPRDPELMKLRAVQMLQQPTPQSLETARAKLEDVIKLEPTAVDVHLILIRLAMQEADYLKARDFAIRAIGSNPDNQPLLLARASAELKLRNTPMAIELARLILRRDPGNSEAMGIVTEIKDRSFLEEARAMIETAAAANPADEKLLLSLARVLVALDMPATAIPRLETYCQTKEGSSSVAAAVTLADLYRLTGDMGKAGQKIEQAERIDPNSLAVIHARFLWLAAQKRFDELSRISSAYLSAKEQNPTTLTAAGAILAASDPMDLKKEALRLFERAVTLAPTLKEARLGLASTLYQTGDANRAVTVYQELLRQYPNDIRVLNDLAWILQEHTRGYDAALELANRGLASDPNEVHLLDTRGTILSKMPDRLADARNDFEKLARLSAPDTRQKATALLNLGRTCAKLNDPARAKQHLQDALEIDRKIGVFTPDERAEIANILGGSSAANR